MSGKPKKDRNKSATSGSSTPQRLLDRATDKSTQIIGSLRARFQPSTSRSQSPLPKSADQSLPPGPVDDTLPNPTSDPTIPDTSERNPVPTNDDVPDDLAITSERNFWKEAIESLTDEYESKDWLPKEWKDLECDGPELLSMVKSAKNDCLKSQWTIRIAGRTINVREYLTKIVDWVQKFAQVGDAAVQFDTAHAALPWAGFRFLLQVAVNEIAVYGGMLAGLERVSWLMWYTSAHEGLFRTYYANNPQSAVTSSRFVIDLISLYKAVLRFLKNADEYYKRTPLERVLLTVVETDAWIREMMATVEDQKGRLESYTDLLSKENIHADSKRILELVKDLEPAKQQIREIHQRIEGIHQRIEGDERIKFLKWISNIRYTDHHKTNFHDVLKGTGQWLLDHPSFSDWMTSGAILWLHGIPGSGKTKLTSIVMDYLQKNKGEHIIAYFYCIRDTAQPERGKPEEILRAILKQLVCSTPMEDTNNPVENTYKRMKDEAIQRGEDPRALELEECVDLILEITSEHPATIIIDALDECQGDKRHELLEAFDRILQRADNPTRIFVSSRDDQDLVLRLENHQNILIGVDENALDIQSFVRKQIEEAIQRKRLLYGEVSPEIKSEIITKLEGGAGGMFRWVSLQVAALCNRDEIKTVEGVKNRLGRLPRDLHKLYDEIYERIKKMEAPELLITQTVLMWLLYAQRQLSADELLSAVSITVGSASILPDTVLDLCFNLVTLNQTPKAFSFAHLSVREYLEGRMEYKPCPSHATITKFCMERFVVGDTSQNYGLLNYARVYWPRHYENAADDGVRSEEIVKAASEFILDKNPNGGLSMWRSSSKHAINSLPWNDNLQQKLRYALSGPLETICVFGFTDLLEHFFKSEHQHRDSRTVTLGLTLAITGRNEITARRLLDEAVKLGNIKLHLGLPFALACHHRLEGIADAITEQESTLHTGGDGRWTLLHWMIIFKFTTGVIYLLDNGAECEKKDADDRTPLHFAAMSGYQVGLEELLRRGARVDLVDKAGWMPWHWATCIGHKEAESKLSSSCQDTNGKYSDDSFVSKLEKMRDRSDRLRRLFRFLGFDSLFDFLGFSFLRGDRDGGFSDFDDVITRLQEDVRKVCDEIVLAVDSVHSIETSNALGDQL